MSSTRKVHKHWVTAIETLHSIDPDKGDDPYGGIRLSVHHTQDEAETDVREWIEDDLERQFASVEIAIKVYRDQTGKRVIIEEQYV